MTIAEQVVANQNIKQMTIEAIKLLESLGADVDDLKADFKAVYKED